MIDQKEELLTAADCVARTGLTVRETKSVDDGHS